MRPLKMYLKDAMIFADFFNKGIKEDIIKSINYLLSKDTYKNFFYSSKNAIRKSFFGAKNQLYISMFVVVLASLTKNVFIITISIVLFFIMYIKYKWKTGDPMRFYRENYFSSELNRKV